MPYTEQDGEVLSKDCPASHDMIAAEYDIDRKSAPGNHVRLIVSPESAVFR